MLNIDLITFLGRLHPLIVHLPIGFMLLGGLFYLLGRQQKYEFLNRALPVLFLLNAIGAIAAALFGWLLADTGGYDPDLLFWHRWAGVGSALVSILAWLYFDGRLTNFPAISGWLIGLLLFLIVMTGHLGGSLTHGSNYLIDPLIGQTDGRNTLSLPEHPDSVIVFRDFVQPVLTAKCLDCHNSETKKSALDLSSWEAMQKGGKSGKVIGASALSSELFARVTLPPYHEKSMPPEGESLTYGEIRLIEWWLNNGAGPESRLTAQEIPPDLKIVMRRDYKFDPVPQPFVETVQIAPLPADTIATLQSAGWRIIKLSKGNNLLEVSPQNPPLVNHEMLQTLLAASNHITWLNLGHANISDQDLEIISQFVNLSRLRLENNQITDGGLRHLIDLPHLESLTLYQNPITNAGLEAIKEMPALKRVYLWETGITATAVDDIRESHQELILETGLQLEEMTEPDSI